jgi:hypothetical protein
MGKSLDITFDIDLGELVDGHHVVARGIELGGLAQLPGVDEDQVRVLIAGDADSNNGGGFFRRGDARASQAHAVETEAELHYEFVPALDRAADAKGGLYWYWMVYAEDDAGTYYSDSNGGAFDGGGGAASHGTRDLGGQVPPSAARLTLRFEPAEGWEPPEPWRREIMIDLRARRLAG